MLPFPLLELHYGHDSRDAFTARLLQTPRLPDFCHTQKTVKEPTKGGLPRSPES